MADIQFSSVTTGVPTGPGYFDVIMKSVMAHVEIEYNQNRLNGTDYATVYLGAMQLAISTAEKFVLAELLTEAQIEATLSDTTIKQAQSTKDLLVKDADIALKTSQKALIDQQRLTEVQNTSKVSYEVLTLLPSQNALLVEQAQTEDSKQASMLVDDAIKQAQSTADLALKAAQTDNYVKQALNTVATTLTEGSKKLLVERQTKGFDDDALQKLLKQSLDSWSVAYSVSTSANAIPTAITVPTIDAIMAKAKTGLSVV